MKYILAILAIATLLSCACESAKEEEGPFGYVEELYAPYLKGDCEAYASHMLSVQDKTETYRRQVVNMLKQQRAITDSLHNGVTKMEVLKVEPSAVNNDYAEAYLLMHYGDNSSEQVILQLVRKDNKWWIR